MISNPWTILIRRPVYSGLVVLAVLLQYPLWIGDGSARSLWGIEQEKASRIAENARMRERNLALAAEVGDLKLGFSAIEERAREELGLVRPGEAFYQIVDQSSVE